MCSILKLSNAADVITFSSLFLPFVSFFFKVKFCGLRTKFNQDSFDSRPSEPFIEEKVIPTREALVIKKKHLRGTGM